MRAKVIAVLFIAMSGVLIGWNTGMARGLIEVSGIIEAVDASARPQTIVVTATTVGRRKLVVGCRVDDKTVIRASHRSEALAGLHAGDRVRLTYLRAEDGLVCRKVRIR